MIGDPLLALIVIFNCFFFLFSAAADKSIRRLKGCIQLEEIEKHGSLLSRLKNMRNAAHAFLYVLQTRRIFFCVCECVRVFWGGLTSFIANLFLSLSRSKPN